MPTIRFASLQLIRLATVTERYESLRHYMCRLLDRNSRTENHMNIYVGNLSYNTTESDLRAAFETHGEVTSAAIIMDKYSGQSKGFGFVEIPDGQSAENAISTLDGSELDGRRITVNEARPRTERSGGGHGRRGGSQNRW